MPVYEYVCRACGAVEEHLQPRGSQAPGPCAACGGQLRRRFSRVAVTYASFGFDATDRLVAPDQQGQDFKALRERAERIADGG